MAREDFLKAAGTAMLAACGPLHAAKGEKIVVVGAGIAGLSAGQKLKAQGYSVVVLEGRPRTGGRIWTDRSLGLPLDLGAAWIHGINGNPVHGMARKLNMQMFRTDFDSVQVFESGKAVARPDLQKMIRLQEALLSKITRRKRTATGSESLADVVLPLIAEAPAGRMRRGMRWLTAADMEIEYAADLGQISLKYYDEDEAFPGDDVLFPLGYSALTDWMASGLDVRTNHTVSKIDYSGQMARVTTNRGTFEADRVVVTLPLGVLKTGQVAFHPPLPAARKNAIGRLGMGTMNKIAMVFADCFWPREIHRLGCLKDDSERLVEFWNLMPLSGKPVLVCLSRGNFARSLDRETPAAAAAFALTELKSMFGSSVKEPAAFVRTSWSTDPFSRGSYSSVAPGASISDYETLASPIEDTLFFAGEAASADHPSTVHGAYLSGQRAAAEIIADA